MKTLQKITLFIALVALFASCQSTTDVNKILSNQDTKMAVIDKIANDSILSKEMMETMMNSENSKMLMMENHQLMMNMMKDNPAMMKSMMTGMLEICRGDSAMMYSMYSTMMGNPEMMEMMHKNVGGMMDMKGMKDMNKMDGMDYK